MGLILLDNPSRGSTALLATAVPPQVSSQLGVGTTPDDNTGDDAFNGGRKIKQSFADANTMFAELYGKSGVGQYLSAVPPASTQSTPTNDWDPAGGAESPLFPSNYGRVDLVPVSPAYLSGLLATGALDDQWIPLRNAGSAIVTLGHLNTNSQPANRFFGPNDDFQLTPGMIVFLIYYGTPTGVNKWVIKT
jgi:hypothetical protein